MHVHPPPSFRRRRNLIAAVFKEDCSRDLESHRDSGPFRFLLRRNEGAPGTCTVPGECECGQFPPLRSCLATVGMTSLGSCSDPKSTPLRSDSSTALVPRFGTND